MSSRIAMTAILAGLLAGGATSGAQAQQPASSGQQAGNPSGWTVNVAPYLWLAAVNTTLKFNLPPAIGGTLSTNSSLGFGDILSHLNFATMVTADARYDRFSLLTDFMYLNLGGAGATARSVSFGKLSVPISTTLQASGGLNLANPIWTLAGGYTVLRGDWGNFDLIGGFRYLRVNARVDFNLGLTLTGPGANGPTFGRVGSVSGLANVWNGIGGFRGRIRLGDTRLFIPYYFDAGAGGSNLTWQIASGLGYRTRWADLSLTYRYLSWEQGGSATVQHLSVRGPMIMANFRF